MVLAIETVGDARLRVLSEGTGPALLYLHDFEGHPGAASFLTRLARERRVIAPELPGYGESSGLEGVDGVLGMILLLRRAVESLAEGPVDVVGHGLGGMLAAEFAAICPHLTRRLVLVDAFGLWLDDAPLPDPFVLNEKQLRAVKWAGGEDAPVEPSIFTPDPNDPSVALLTRAKNLAAATKFMWPIPDRGLRGRLQYVTAPALVVHGAADGLIPVAYAEEFVRLLPNARMVQIDGAGHLPMVEREDAFLEAVEAFLG